MGCMQQKRASLWPALGMLAVVVATSTGCIGMATQLLYVLKGHRIPAAYDGLKNQRVAVVCVSDSSAFGPNGLTESVGRAVGGRLAANVKKITIVPPGEIENWIDVNGWDEKDFTKIGRGVKADRVVAIEMGNYTIREGQTLYKGRCELSVTVYDIANGGSVAYSVGPKEYAFPQNGRPAIQTSDRKFETLYLGKLTEHITNQFYPHDALDSVAEDATMWE